MAPSADPCDPLSPVLKLPLMLGYGPNISGKFLAVFNRNPVSGVFSDTGENGHSKAGGDNDAQSILFDASSFNSVYAGSHTVQPDSMLVLPCVKT